MGPAAKDAIGTALGTSRGWFTVANGADFWIELRRLDNYTVNWQEETIPAITIIHHHARFTLTLKIGIDLERDVLLADFKLEGDADLRLYLLAAPRIDENATDNQAWTDEWQGHCLLWAEKAPFGMALTAVDREGRPALMQRSVGLVGRSDGWRDSHANQTTLRPVPAKWR